MDRFFSDRIKADTPKMNADIINGLAVKIVPLGERYVDDVWRSASRDFPPGLEYVGGSRCTPTEEFNEEPRKRSDRRVIEMARTDVYLMKYMFSYKGEMLPPRYIYLPFVSEAGSVVLSGARFFISPVLSDTLLSYEPSNIFVRLLRDKFAIKRVTHDIVIAGKRETIPVVWSLIYHINSEQKSKSKKIKAKSSLIHYMLCRYGFTETFQRFAGFIPIVGTYNINESAYPAEDGVIGESRQIAPKDFGTRYDYHPTEIRMAIPKTKFTPMMRSMVAAIFYIIEHFPDRVQPEHLDSKRLWKILMGLILFGNSKGEGGLHDDVDEHIRSLDEYMDTLVIQKFKDIGLHCEDIYQFFAIAIERFNDWIIEASDRVNSLYDKELSILYDVYKPITESIFNFLFKLKTAARKELTKSEIVNTMNNHLKPRSIFALTKNAPGVSSMSYSGDNKFLKITSVMVPQKNSKLKSGGDDSTQSMTDPSKRLHTSFATVGNYCNLPKSNPTGDSRINPNLEFDDKCRVVRNSELAALLDKTQQMIKRD